LIIDPLRENVLDENDFEQALCKGFLGAV